MKTDPSKSVYHEAEDATREFTREEIKHLRLLLRRLRFLEAQVVENGGIAGTGPGSAFAEWERDATAWILDELGYLKPRDKVGSL